MDKEKKWRYIIGFLFFIILGVVVYEYDIYSKVYIIQVITSPVVLLKQVKTLMSLLGIGVLEVVLSFLRKREKSQDRKGIRIFFCILIMYFGFLWGVLYGMEDKNWESLQQVGTTKKGEELIDSSATILGENGGIISIKAEATYKVKHVYTQKPEKLSPWISIPVFVRQLFEGKLWETELVVWVREVQDEEQEPKILNKGKDSSTEQTQARADKNSDKVELKESPANQLASTEDDEESPANQPVGTQDDEEYHIVIVHDVSGSMKQVAGYEQVVYMIDEFIDRIPKAQYPLKIAVVSFADQPYAITENNGRSWQYLKDYKNQSLLDNIKNNVNNTEYDGSNTDIGRAMEYCADILEDMQRGTEKKSRKIVLFITDGLIDVNTKKGFEEDIESYKDLMTAAERIPEDCYFLGLIPSKESLGNRLQYEYDNAADKEVIRKYLGIAVPDDKRKEITEVADGMKNFQNRLRERHPKEQLFKADLCELNWKDADVMKQIRKKYDDYFKAVFRVDSVIYDNILSELEFKIPGTSETIINVTPHLDNIEEKRELVESIIQNKKIRVQKKDGTQIDCLVINSGISATVKLFDLEPGIYIIQCFDEAEMQFDIAFYSYADVDILLDRGSWIGCLGETVRITGKINDNQENSDMDFEEYLKLWIRDLADDSYEEIEVEPDGSFAGEYILRSAGSKYITIGATYDDSVSEDNIVGVTSFTVETSALEVSASDVSYELIVSPEDVKCGETVTFHLAPYSMVGSEKKTVKAEICEEYMEDQWELFVDGDSKGELELSPEGEYYEIETSFSEEKKYIITLKRNGTDTDISKSLQVNNSTFSVTAPKEVILGKPVHVDIRLKNGINVDEGKITVTNPNGEICEETQLDFSSGKAEYEFTTKAKGDYELNIEVPGHESLKKTLSVLNNAPKATDLFQDHVVRIACLPWGECFAEENIKGWFVDPDDHDFDVKFGDNEYFEVVPKNIENVQMKDKITIKIRRKSLLPVHMWKTTELPITVIDKYGEESPELKLVVKEEPDKLVVIMIVIILSIATFPLIVGLYHRSTAVKIIIRYNGKKEKTIWPKAKTGVRKDCTVKGNPITVTYNDGDFYYTEERKSQQKVINGCIDIQR